MAISKYVSIVALTILLGVACDDEDPIPTQPTRDNVIRVPSEALTLQDAIDSIGVGDTVLVAPGTYTGDGNRDIQFNGNRFTLLSEGGPNVTIIDCQGSEADPHFAFQAAYQPDGTHIIGFTIRRAYSSQGSAIDCHVSDLTVINCVFDSNTATVAGGAVRCKSSSPFFINCTFVGNSAPFGGAVHLMANSTPEFRRCIIANSHGSAIGMNGASDTPTLMCSNIYGNSGGNWDNYIAEQAPMRNNQSADPQFCGPRDYHLRSNSPCAPGNNGCGQQIGALGVGCEPAQTANVSMAPHEGDPSSPGTKLPQCSPAAPCRSGTS